MSGALRQLGLMLYVVDRNSTTFETQQEVPKYLNEAIPTFTLLLLLEFVVLFVAGHGRVRMGDVLTSSGHGLLYDISKLVVHYGELSLYQWLYQYRVLDLDWRSVGTWWMAALFIDLAYYWYHRAVHEVNLGWAAHQVHHSSQDYNLSTALRQSVFQHFFALPAYTPLALLGIPLPAIIVHIQLNLLYQFWIHTELVGTLGPLEWVFNTPSHHRVHHGANKWCLDRNYGGVLIIWDRLFGTFEAERRNQPGQEIAYGLVGQPQTYNTLYLQLFYYQAVFTKAFSMSTWGDLFRALFYGPGWTPGNPRLGDPTTFPDVKAPRPLYGPEVPLWQQVYATTHYFICLILQQILVTNSQVLSWDVMVCHLAFIVVTLGVIGGLYDRRWWWVGLDWIRCITFLAYWTHVVVSVIPWPLLDSLVASLMVASVLLQTSRAITHLWTSLTTHKKIIKRD
ncbi:hypothetical protein Pmani_018526 [Petrolisthes manimaculis]|uniref:Alkylglycerol monooxygenase n=1 Tax=Petrolisthes manimaculis TaxID=1843537 RepID=A0AAE1PK15_9EUCA|nr:hypothetical protein Pmani_018526 [Petrolisthes manimaculis]